MKIKQYKNCKKLFFLLKTKMDFWRKCFEVAVSLLMNEAKASGVRFSAWVSRSIYLGLKIQAHVGLLQEIMLNH